MRTMSIKIEGDVTIMINDSHSRDDVLIWTIGEDMIPCHIDRILEKYWQNQYARFGGNNEVILLDTTLPNK